MYCCMHTYACMWSESWWRRKVNKSPFSLCVASAGERPPFFDLALERHGSAAPR